MNVGLAAALAAVRSRGEVKRLGEAVDADPLWRQDLVQRLIDAGEDAAELARWSGKKLVRAALERAERVQRRLSPIRVDEGFTCLSCGLEVPPHGRTARDHCPRCLRSRHVDVIPGDRAADCGGPMEVVDVRVGPEVVLRYRCQRCGFERNMRALLDGQLPDDWTAIVAASRRTA